MMIRTAVHACLVIGAASVAACGGPEGPQYSGTVRAPAAVAPSSTAAPFVAKHAPERAESKPTDAEDPNDDREGFGKACMSNGDGGACLAAAYRLGWRGGFRHDLKVAEMLLVHGCTLGDADACSMLADKLRLGELPAATKARSAALYERACTLGSKLACVSVAVDVWDGVLEPADRSKGAAMLRAQCDAGGDANGTACARLARFAESGALGQSHVADARALDVRACRLGIVQSCDRVK